VTKWRR